MTQTIILTILATIVAYRLLIELARTGGPGGRRESLGRLLGLRSAEAVAGVGAQPIEGMAVALRRSGGAGEE